jgi:predicted ATP-dependent Lon-type protease
MKSRIEARAADRPRYWLRKTLLVRIIRVYREDETKQFFATCNRAFTYRMGQKVKMKVGQQVDTTDFHVEAIDLLCNHVPYEAGIALVVAIYSALKRLPVQAGFVILGDLSILGNI